VSDIYAPLDGVIIEVNTDLADAPQRLNEDPYGDGWICVIQTAEGAGFSDLMDAEAYRNLIST
jgi:glycine cleavage system H protein